VCKFFFVIFKTILCKEWAALSLPTLLTKEY
jgi:hypothetical protein